MTNPRAAEQELESRGACDPLSVMHDDPKKRKYYVEGPGINAEIGFDSYNEACVCIAKLPLEIQQNASVVPRKLKLQTSKGSKNE